MTSQHRLARNALKGNNMRTRERNQGSIKGNLPGQWAIFSTFQPESWDQETAMDYLKRELEHAASCIGPVAVLEGCWDGEWESSLMVYASDAFSYAKSRAREYGQIAFIYAPGDGTAELYMADLTDDGEIVGYSLSETYTRIEIVEPMSNGDFAFEDDNFSVLPSGLAFRLR